MKILIGINTLTVLHREVYSNHAQFFYRIGKNHPDKQFGIFTPPRMTIDRMRNTCAAEAIKHGFDYILFIDDDVLIPMDDTIDTVQKLLDCKADIAAGWTVIRGYPFENMFFQYTEDGKGLEKDNEPSIGEDGIVKCGAVGFSCCLIDVNLLKRIPPPYFITGTHNTEDIYFCVKAKQYVPDVNIVVQTKIKTGHILGIDIVTPDNKEHRKKYEEDAYEAGAKDEVIVDRGDKYLEMIGESA